MTLYAVLDSTGVKEDTYVWQESKKRFWFAGATLTMSAKTEWESNQVLWDQYYILRHNHGIGVRGDRICYIEDNREVHTTYANVELLGIGSHSTSFRESDPQSLVRWGANRWSGWHKIARRLENSRSLESSQAILFVMQQWEKASHQTLSWVKKTMKNQADSQDVIEIYVAHHQWLWHNSTKGIVTLGYKKRIWGNVHLHSGNTIISRGALPIGNGWFVGITNSDRYLLLWDGHGIKVKAIVFPRGQWSRHSTWKHWPHDSTVLTSNDQLIAVPHALLFKKAELEWALCENKEDPEHIMIIGCRGEVIDLDKSEYGESLLACPGERNMLIAHSNDHGQCFFSIARIEPVSGIGQKFCPHWRSLATPDFLEVYHCVALRDKTDVFVVFFVLSPLLWGVCLIDAQGRFWQPHILFGDEDDSLYPNVGTCVKSKDGRAVVVRIRRPAFMGDNPTIVIGVSDGWGYVKLDAGTVMSGPLVPLPGWGNDLQKQLDLVFNPARPSQM